LLGERLRWKGRSDESLAELIMAQRLDPESEHVNALAAWIYLHLGHLAAAAQCYERCMATNPPDDIEAPQALIDLYTALGEKNELHRVARIAVARAEQAVAQDPSNGFAMGVLVNGFAALGQGEPAREWARRAIAIDPGNTIMRYNIASAMNVHLKDVETAVELLEEVFAEDTPVAGRLLKHAKGDPTLDLAKADSRIQALIARAEARLSASAAADAASA